LTAWACACLGQALTVTALDENFFGFRHAHLKGEQIGFQGTARLIADIHDAQLGAGGFHRFFSHGGEVGGGENIIVGTDGGGHDLVFDAVPVQLRNGQTGFGHLPVEAVSAAVEQVDAGGDPAFIILEPSRVVEVDVRR